MVYRILADLTVTGHGLFVAFVVFGGLWVRKRPSVAWLHLPCAAWGILIEFRGWICPLTPLENHLRRLGGEAGYGGGFVEHYVLPILYPPGLTRDVQVALGVLVLGLNLAVYGWVMWRRAHAEPPGVDA